MKESRLIHVLFYLILCLWLAFALFPLYWILQTSFKPAVEQSNIPPTWFPKNISFENYSRLFLTPNLVRTILNSFIITSFSVSLSLLLGVPASYGIVKLKKGSQIISFLVLSIRMLPPIVFIIPFFLISRRYSMYDTYPMIIAVYTFMVLPIVVWMMIGYFDDIPTEIEEAALVDGCSPGRIFIAIVIPLVRGGLFGTAILAAIIAWNEFLFALVLTGQHTRILPVLVNSFVTQRSVDYGLMCATGIIMVIPMAVLGIITQKNLVRGLTMGALK
ncbi:MAG: carbohydrate ABC transporter permease [Spirochaetales bacterium]|nr:carbohydrate ABC transporter permease [Spirochaetales bacterium]